MSERRLALGLKSSRAISKIAVLESGSRSAAACYKQLTFTPHLSELEASDAESSVVSTFLAVLKAEGREVWEALMAWLKSCEEQTVSMREGKEVASSHSELLGSSAQTHEVLFHRGCAAFVNCADFAQPWLLFCLSDITAHYLSEHCTLLLHL